MSTVRAIIPVTLPSEPVPVMPISKTHRNWLTKQKKKLKGALPLKPISATEIRCSGCNELVCFLQ